MSLIAPLTLIDPLPGPVVTTGESVATTVVTLAETSSDALPSRTVAWAGPVAGLF